MDREIVGGALMAEGLRLIYGLEEGAALALSQELLPHALRIAQRLNAEAVGAAMH